MSIADQLHQANVCWGRSSQKYYWSYDTWKEKGIQLPYVAWCINVCIRHLPSWYCIYGNYIIEIFFCTYWISLYVVWKESQFIYKILLNGVFDFVINRSYNIQIFRLQPGITLQSSLLTIKVLMSILIAQFLLVLLMLHMLTNWESDDLQLN